jgi:hypothetical protein
MKKLFQIQIVRNLFGAVMGAAIALAFYGVYQVGASMVAYLISDPRVSTQSTTQFTNTDVAEDSEKFKRAAARALHISQMLQMQEAGQRSSDTFIETYFVSSSVASSESSVTGRTHNIAAFPNAVAPRGKRDEELAPPGSASSQSQSSVTMQAVTRREIPSPVMHDGAPVELTEAPVTSAPTLPSSGPAEWIAMFIAFALAVPLNKKIQDRLLWSPSEEEVH